MTANEGKDDDSEDENDAVSDDGFVYAEVEVVSVEGTDSDDEDERRKEVLCLGEEDRQNGGSEASPSPRELTEEKVEDVNNIEKKKKKKKRRMSEQEEVEDDPTEFFPRVSEEVPRKVPVDDAPTPFVELGIHKENEDQKIQRQTQFTSLANATKTNQDALLLCERLRREIQTHKTHRLRLEQEKREQMKTIKRLKKEAEEVFAPAIEDLNAKYGVAMKDRTMLTIERNKLMKRIKGLEKELEELRDAQTKKKKTKKEEEEEKAKAKAKPTSKVATRVKAIEHKVAKEEEEREEEEEEFEEEYALHLNNFTSPLYISQTNKGELGCRVWNCALALCEYLSVSSSLSFPLCVLKNKAVLEVGCGVGLGGFVAASLGAKTVCLADCGKNTLENVSKTLERWDALVRMKEGVFADVESRTTKWESRYGRIRLRTHLWEEDEEIVNALVEKRRKESVRHWSKTSGEDDVSLAPKMADDETFDVIILSDCLYYSSQELPLAKSLALRLKKDLTSTIVLFQTRRTTNKLVEERFRICCEAQGLEVAVEDVALEKPKRSKLNGVHETAHTIGYARMIMKWRAP